jgi:hypothetical protein
MIFSGKRRPTEDLDELNKKNKITNDMVSPANNVLLDLTFSLQKKNPYIYRQFV